MDSQTLERLLIDRSLGALSPEVDTLLKAYLETDDDAARAAGELSETVSLAKQSLGDRPSTRLPAFPEDRLRRAMRQRHRLVLFGGVTGLAASLMMGIGIGLLLRGEIGGEQDTAIPTAIRAPVVHVTIDSGQSSMESTNLWSTRRLRNREPGTTRIQGGGLIWNSPVREPKMGGST